MLAVTRRIANLEKQIIGARKLIVMKVGPGEEQVDALLEENGFRRDDPGIDLIILRTIYEDRNGGVDKEQPKARILYTMDIR